jgi:hypothetical protein
MVIPALIAAGASLVGNIIGQNSAEATNRSNQKFSEKQRLATEAYNSAEAQKNRDWQTEMDNTKVQRTQTDLKAAGINPILAGQYSGGTPSGGAASSPGGNGVQGETPNKGDTAAQMIEALQAITNMKNTSAQKKKTDAETETINKIRNAQIEGANSASAYDRAKTESEAKMRKHTESQIKEIEQRIKESQAKIKNTENELKIAMTKHDLDKIREKRELLKQEQEFYIEQEKLKHEAAKIYQSMATEKKKMALW